MSSIFISYSHNDKTFVRKLAADLRNANHTVWIDETDISVGDSILEKLSDAIKNVDFVVAIISSASVNSRWVQKELDLASNRELNENRIVLLPVLLNDVQLPGFLYGKFYLDFSNKDNYQECLVKLLEKLETDSTPQNVSFDQIFLKPYLFIETEGHGWLRVPLSELSELDISNKVTGYSYMDNLYAYLEEDDDLVTFIEAKERRNGHSYEVERDACTVFVNDDEFSSFCNRLLSFETSTPKPKKKTKSRIFHAVIIFAAIATILIFFFGDNILGRISKEFKSNEPTPSLANAVNNANTEDETAKATEKKANGIRARMCDDIFDEFKQLVEKQVERWGSFNSGKGGVKTFDGKSISFSGGFANSSKRILFWKGYIEPYIQDVIERMIEETVELAKDKKVPLSMVLGSTEANLSGGIDTVYHKMQGIDRRLRGGGDPESVPMRDISFEIKKMNEFLDRQIKIAEDLHFEIHKTGEVDKY